MSNEQERHALLAKGRLLFDSCSPENEYACVIGYVDHNLAQGGWRAEVMAEFIGWLRQQRDMPALRRPGNVAPQHAAAILQRLDKKSKRQNH
jgi:hypothetical protein